MKWTQNGTEFEGTVEEYDTLTNMIKPEVVKRTYYKRHKHHKHKVSSMYRKRWTKLEVQILKRNKDKSIKDLMQILPFRGRDAIVVKLWKIEHKK
jgi:small nuclear ribonucleoprotein (snRNP)-like protein